MIFTFLGAVLIAMALSAIFVDSVTAMEQHLAIIVNAMIQIIHVLLETTQYVELKKHAQALVIKLSYSIVYKQG